MKLSDIKFPPVGGTGRFLITCDGKPFASFDTAEQAAAVKAMYARPVRKAKGSCNCHEKGGSCGSCSYNATRDWKIETR